MSRKTQAELIKEKYPNEAQFTGGKERETPEDNYFQNEDLSEFRKRYLRFNYIMELLHDTLELDKYNTSMEDLMKRIADIILASRREK